MALSLVVGGRWPTLLFGGLAALLPTLLLLLAARRLSLAMKLSIIGLGVWLLLSLLGVVWLAERRPVAMAAGLPLATWIMLLAIGVAPLPWIVALYLRAFGDD